MTQALAVAAIARIENFIVTSVCGQSAKQSRVAMG